MEGVAQPSGTVTLVFTDIEGSTRLLTELGRDGYHDALAGHRAAVRDAFAPHGGYEVDTQGDSFFYAFTSAPEAVDAVSEALRALEPGPIRIRVGLHTGTPGLDGPNYVGLEVHKAARIMAAGHGGQVLMSRATRELLDGSVPLRDLGEHVLKDFDRPERLYQLGDRSFAPLKTISNTNLPRPTSSFVGRDSELAELTDLLDSGRRFITLTGPGGTGKTRLAIEAATGVVDRFGSGVFWVGLAAVRDAERVVPAISQVVGAREGLAEHVGERDLLLVLDNVEQAIEAGPELADLVETCPNLVLLVTSRERLAVRTEAELEVAPLPDDDAVALFVERSRLEPTSVAEELCRRLDNMPLALELAAARTKTLAPDQILGRLGTRLDLLTGGRDADPRQRSLRATIEWSYDLLSSDERRLFSRLAIFAGGCTLEAAEEVCDADLDTLGSLVEKSLVRHAGGRYWMLETIRHYALERLDQSGERETLAERQAAWMLDLAERHDTLLITPRSDEDIDVLGAEHENGLSALAYLLARDPATALRLAAALAVAWDRLGRGAESLRLLTTAMTAAPGADPAVMAKARYRAGHLLVHVSLDDALSSFDEALALYETAGDRTGAVLSGAYRGEIALAQGKLNDAEALAAAALEEAGKLGDAPALWLTSCFAAQVREQLDNPAAGRGLHLDAIRFARMIGPLPIIRALHGLGWNELLAEEYTRARDTNRELLERISPRDRFERLNTLINLGWADLFLDDLDEARVHVAEGFRLAWDVRDGRVIAEAAFESAAIRADEPALAARLWGAAHGLIAQSRGRPYLMELRCEQRWLEPLRVEYRADYELGTTLGLDETVELALSAT
jgi:predicted ATPase/class 3 adenylate cyclase